MKNHLFLERTGNNQIDTMALDRAKNPGRWIALLIMNSGVSWKRKSPQGCAEFFSYSPCVIAHINQGQLRPKPITNAFSLGQHLIEPRRERARHSDRTVRRRLGHSLSIVSDGAIFRQIAPGRLHGLELFKRNSVCEWFRHATGNLSWQ